MDPYAELHNCQLDPLVCFPVLSTEDLEIPAILDNELTDGYINSMCLSACPSGSRVLHDLRVCRNVMLKTFTNL